VLDRLGRTVEVQQGDPDLAAIVGVDGTGSVDDRDAAVEREAGARPDLRLGVRGQRDREAGRNEGAAERLERERRSRVAQVDAPSVAYAGSGQSAG
jgi:hypothetical protein